MKVDMKKGIYLDYNATTPVADSVLEAMMPYFQKDFGNTLSAAHAWGWDANQAVENARKQVARLLNCQTHELYFTSGATESNNWVVQGLIEQIRLQNPNEKIHLITSPVEHNSVIKSFEHAKRLFHVDVDWAPVNQYGQVDVAAVQKLIRPETKLMSFMWVNNEVGSINPMQQLSLLARENKIYLHTDATQALGKIPIHLEQLPVDFLSFSAHKIYGPKGIGALYVRNHNPRVEISPFIWGGGHERGQRSGTLNTPAIVGMGVACEWAQTNLDSETTRLENLRNQMWAQIQKSFPTAILNGHPHQRAANNLNVSFINCQIPATIPGLAISRGSACLSGGISTSHVLKALGLNEVTAAVTLRISLGMQTDEQQILQAVEILKHHIKPA